ncbi:hypothetical protein BIW11_02490 [Tropilaelaps mercedesae]|uniref:Uncharacterized protein n=1 Tax=Tropilaelaps mercedesae TaxID=418985 RepID=A0A1V9Y2B4_9ACAR|nr:hypothetical protein BIW11_02490 [Tropilaelaps mercedesae]
MKVMPIGTTLLMFVLAAALIGTAYASGSLQHRKFRFDKKIKDDSRKLLHKPNAPTTELS